MIDLLLSLKGEKIDEMWVDENGIFEVYDTITIDIGNGLNSYKVVEVRHDGLVINTLH